LAEAFLVDPRWIEPPLRRWRLDDEGGWSAEILEATRYYPREYIVFVNRAQPQRGPTGFVYRDFQHIGNARRLAEQIVSTKSLPPDFVSAEELELDSSAVRELLEAEREKDGG
jgi:hypothetical protein